MLPTLWGDHLLDKPLWAAFSSPAPQPPGPRFLPPSWAEPLELSPPSPYHRCITISRCGRSNRSANAHRVGCPPSAHWKKVWEASCNSSPSTFGEGSSKSNAYGLRPFPAEQPSVAGGVSPTAAESASRPSVSGQPHRPRWQSGLPVSPWGGGEIFNGLRPRRPLSGCHVVGSPTFAPVSYPTLRGPPQGDTGLKSPAGDRPHRRIALGSVVYRQRN